MNEPSQMEGIEEGQTTFKLSVASSLLLVRPPIPGWKKVLKPPSSASKGLLSLPNELLNDIIYQVVPSHLSYNYTRRPDHYEPYMALARMCWRLYQLVIPMMYSQLHLCIGTEKYLRHCDKYPVEVMRKLQRSFEENPRLGEFCESLNITLHNPSSYEAVSPIPSLDEDAEADIEVITALAALLPGIKTIDIVDDFNLYPEIWTILRIASINMPKLEEVRLNSFVEDTCGPICESLCGTRTLKFLELPRGGEGMGALKDVTEHHPICIEKMCISTFRDRLESLRRLVSWPESVEYLDLEVEGRSRSLQEDSSVPWGLPALLPIIACHKDKLRGLGIGRLPVDNRGLFGFDVSDFPNLEGLVLNRYTTGNQVAELANLLAPRLSQFIWCFNISGELHNVMECDVCDFGEPEENWLRSLMRTAIDQKASLSHVHIEYTPSWEWTRQSDLSDIVPPWNRIDMLREEFRHAGIKVTCSSRYHEGYKQLWEHTRPDYERPITPRDAHLPPTGFQLPDIETDSESMVELDGENQSNKITRYFRPLPSRRRSL